MTAALFVLALALVLTVAIVAVVVVGGTSVLDETPVSGHLRRMNEALNGEGEVPKKLSGLVR